MEQSHQQVSEIQTGAGQQQESMLPETNQPRLAKQRQLHHSKRSFGAGQLLNPLWHQMIQCKQGKAKIVTGNTLHRQTCRIRPSLPYEAQTQ